ncbi:hypothetical protein LJC11_05130 [Bacteroidales bacterium OttesenSCG-928-I21]|nr:hypothetical protein [Bacteroidales bacterium OttesenSCG-928-I21]
MESLSLKSPSKGENNCVLHVYNCDQPYNTVSSDVNVIMRNEFGSLITVLPTKRVGDGNYSVTIPDEFVPKSITIKPFEIQKQMVEILNVVAYNVCEAYDVATGRSGGVIEGTQLCVAISSALIASGIGVTVVPEFFAACETVVIALDLSCALYQIIGQDLYNGLANLFDYDFKINEGYLLIPKVQGMPYSIIGEQVYVGPSNPLSDMYMSVNGKTRIRDFSLIPSNPIAEESYQAVAEIYCIRSGSLVEMSIAGTDGYSDSQTDYFPEGAVEQKCSLWVPGAESGIRDKCVIKVYCPDGTVLTQNATLVFR